MSTVKKTEDIEAKPSIVGLNYRVLKKIGEGSFGVIYEGTVYFLVLFSIRQLLQHHVILIWLLLLLHFVCVVVGVHILEKQPVAIKFVSFITCFILGIPQV